MTQNKFVCFVVFTDYLYTASVAHLRHKKADKQELPDRTGNHLSIGSLLDLQVIAPTDLVLLTSYITRLH